VDHPFGILADAGVARRLRFEVVFDEVVRRHQFGRSRARQQVAARIVGMAHADMPEGVDDAFVGDHAVGKREFGARVFKRIGHCGFLSCGDGWVS
jgi:hypothetical protein